MKFCGALLVFLAGLCSVKAQTDINTLNQYKYVYLTSGNVVPFARYTLYDDVLARLTECGMKVIKRKERQQISDTCTIVFCDLTEAPATNDSGHLNTCIRLQFTDCNRKLVFVSKVGYSGVWFKGTKWGYEMAASEAMQSFDHFHYSYLAR